MSPDELDEAPTDLWIRSTAPKRSPPPPAPLRSGKAGPDAGEGDVLSADEVADILRIDRKTVYEFAGRGEIPCRRLGRRILFYRPALMAWLSHARPRRAGEEDSSNASTS